MEGEAGSEEAASRPARPIWPHLLFIAQESLLLLQATGTGILKCAITEITGLLGPLKLILYKSAVQSKY